MSVNTDRRVRRTRRSIQQALVRLTLEKGYERVTVSDIIRRADVGRSTFYAHFTDKQDVLFSHLDELAFLHPEPSAESSPLAFSRPMFEHVAEQRLLIQALHGRSGGGLVMARGEQMLATVVRDELLARGAATGTSLDLLVSCVVGAFMTLMRRWVDGELDATAAELDDAFQAAILPGVVAALASGA